MQFETLTDAHIPEAIALAQADLAREARHVPALAALDVAGMLADRVSEIVRDGFCGVAATEDDRLVGFLTFLGPFERFFGTTPGAWSPLHAHALAGDNRERLWSRLVQHAADRLIAQGVTGVSVTTYAHDDGARGLTLNSFGIRLADAIRDLSAPYTAATPDGYRHIELTGDDVRQVFPLENALIRHLRSSPMFLPLPETRDDTFIARQAEQGARFFATFAGDTVVGYIKVTDEGETFLTTYPDMPNITGAYLRPEHRGHGVYDSLLAFTMDTLRAEGARLLGVDFETMNPTALHFWEKAFDIYTYSHVRRIDERILEVGS